MNNLAQTTQKLVDEITNYLDNIPEIHTLDYSQTKDIPLIHKEYSNIMVIINKLSKLIIKSQYFISKMEIAMNSLSNNTIIESKQKTEMKQCIYYVQNISKPLYEEKERLTKSYFYFEKMYKTYVSPM